MNLFDNIQRISWLRPNYDLAKERVKLEELRAKEEQIRKDLYFQMAESAKLRLEEILGHSLSSDIEQLSNSEDLGSLPNPTKSTSYRPFYEVILANATLHNPEDPVSVIELQHVLVSDQYVKNQEQLWVLLHSNPIKEPESLYSYYKFDRQGGLISSSTRNDQTRTLPGLSNILNNIRTWETSS